ncbi:MAG: NAD(P)-binding protein, partial [Planctomycetota bacterium]
GELVLYWMHSAMRAHENPALDVAIRLAQQNGLPLLVYMGLSEDYPYASDRLHTFMLQGQRDVLAQLRQRGVSASCFVARHGSRGRHLRDLVKRSAVLVSEEMPAQPIADWVDRLQRGCRTPIALVDSACVVPLSRFEKPLMLPSKFRDATSAEYLTTLSQPYPEQDDDILSYDGQLPFEALDLENSDLASLLGACRIDHSIPPVAETPGGSRAGYARWRAFSETHLLDYGHRHRDAADWQASSRISAYMHFGMISPFRIAREALAIAQRDGFDPGSGRLPREGGVAKFLDQVLIWREMAFHYCFHRIHSIDSLDAIPAWARETLQQHASDPRPATLSWERLARGQSGFRAWDLFQLSLIRQGELHNNARMSWCKGLLQLTSTPDRAFHYALDLNHRFALDGRSPSSHGGVIWCFGGFDRPRDEEVPVFGKVRARTLEQAAEKVDVAAFARRVHRPLAERLPRVAVVGAGLGGLVAARTLADQGLDVTVYDKSRGVGGRMATRRVDLGESESGRLTARFDHGAQYFTARDVRFQRFVRSWIEDGVAAPWMARIVELAPGGTIVDQKMQTPRYVGVPGMNAIAKHLATDLLVELRHTLVGLKRDKNHQWSLAFDEADDAHGFDVVLFNPPPAQTAAIVKRHPAWHDRLAGIKMQPCLATLFICQNTKAAGFDAAFINEGPLSWIARNDSKPGRVSTVGEQWVLHASPEWSSEHLEWQPDRIGDEMICAFQNATGVAQVDVRMRQTHRWRYALGDEENPLECLWDATVGLGACGDWLAGGRVEGAFLSGQAAAGAVLRHYTIDRAAAVLTP